MMNVVEVVAYLLIIAASAGLVRVICRPFVGKDDGSTDDEPTIEL